MSENLWSEEELRASVEAYAQMWNADQEGRKVNKAAIYRDLEARFGRRNKAFERRMMNISHVVKSLGGTPVAGLLPAPNIGANTGPRLKAIVLSHGFLDAALTIRPATTSETEADKLEAKVASLTKDWRAVNTTVEPPVGLDTPKSQACPVKVFERSPEVKAWILENSGYVCESCGKEAPFKRQDGTPYLEVHHVVRLADGGPDTVSNTVAVCPDCHRALHFSGEKERLLEHLYDTTPRLARP